jgi:hypothetical protein
MSQQTLFEDIEMIPWAAEWQNMPEFSHEDLQPKFQLIINFACAGDIEDFGRAIGRDLKGRDNSRQLSSIWFPDQEIGRMMNKRYIAINES